MFLTRALGFVNLNLFSRELSVVRILIDWFLLAADELIP